MTALSEIVRSEGKRVGAARKASVVRAGAKYWSEQGSDYEPGISAETAGSKVLFLGIVTLPAGARTRAHVHERHETALYLLDGELEIRTGDQLQHREIRSVRRLHLHPGKRSACCSQSRRESRGVHRHAQ